MHFKFHWTYHYAFVVRSVDIDLGSVNFCSYYFMNILLSLFIYIYINSSGLEELNCSM